MSKSVEIIKKKDLSSPALPTTDFQLRRARIETQNALNIIALYRKTIGCAKYQEFLRAKWNETNKIVSA